jgi:hypothetical protein
MTSEPVKIHGYWQCLWSNSKFYAKHSPGRSEETHKILRKSESGHIQYLRYMLPLVGSKGF